jgi:hypothetical protein
VIGDLLQIDGGVFDPAADILFKTSMNPEIMRMGSGLNKPSLRITHGLLDLRTSGADPYAGGIDG